MEDKYVYQQSFSGIIYHTNTFPTHILIEYNFLLRNGMIYYHVVKKRTPCPMAEKYVYQQSFLGAIYHSNIFATHILIEDNLLLWNAPIDNLLPLI